MFRKASTTVLALSALAMSWAVPKPAVAGPIQFVSGHFNQEGPSWFSRASEPTVAVGPAQVFTQLQGNVRIFTKAGALHSDYGPHVFYGVTDSYTSPTYQIDQPVPGGALSAQDPVAVFDPVARRFYAMVFSYLPDSPLPGHLHLCISQSDNLDSGWYVYHIAGHEDRPVLGYNDTKIVITSSSGFCGHSMRVFNKAMLLSGQATVVPHQTPNDFGTHYDLAPANYIDVDTPEGSVGFERVCRSLSATNDIYLMNIGQPLTVRRMSGTTWNSVTFPEGPVYVTIPSFRSPTSTKQKDLTVPEGWSYLHVSGGPAEPWYRNGKITVARHQADPTYTLNEIQILQVNVADMTNVTLQSELYGQPGLSLAYPAAITDADGNLYVGFNASNENIYPSCYITARRATEATLESPAQLVKAGEVPSWLSRYGGATRAWGDFTGIALDECTSTPPVAYYIGQFMKDSPGTQDHTPGWVLSFNFPPPGCSTQLAPWIGRTGAQPTARWDASMIWDGINNRLVLFGGHDGSNYLSDLWSYDPATLAWSSLTATGTPPTARRGHTAIYDAFRGRMVVYGGENQTGPLGGVYALSLAGAPAWSTLTTAGGPPSARSYHTAVYDASFDRMVTTGGSGLPSDHTWALSFATNQWTALAGSGGSPLAMEGCSAVYDPIGQRMLVFGGRARCSCICPQPSIVDRNDVYSLPLNPPGNWIQLFPSGSVLPRAFAAAVYEAQCQRMLVFGGINDVECGNACGQLVQNPLDDAIALSLTGSLAWSTSPATCYIPPARGHHVAGFDPNKKTWVVFGGGGKQSVGPSCPTTYRNDTWTLQLGTATGGGGGGCPFLDTWSAGTWQEENSILGRSTSGEMQRDLYALSHAPDVEPDGTVRVRIREDEQERTRLAEARLVAVDRNPDQASWAHDGRVMLGTKVPVARVTSSTGEDLTARLSDPTGQGLECLPGAILNVELYEKSGPEAGSVKLDLGGLLVRPSKKEIGTGPAKDDGQILRNSGILVQKPDGNGGWVELARIRPREHASDLTVDATRELRLVFEGRHRIHNLAWVRLDPNAPVLAELRPTTAMHTVAGEIAPRISGTTADEVTISPGERVEMAFQVRPVPAGKARDYYLVARGVYTTISAGNGASLAGVPRRIELYAARPNPTAGSVQLSFGLPAPAHVRISIFDVAGRLVSRPVDRPFEAGRHDASWDLMSNRGTRVGSGMYFYRMEVGGWRQERKLVVQ